MYEGIWMAKNKNIKILLLKTRADTKVPNKEPTKRMLVTFLS